MRPSDRSTHILLSSNRTDLAEVFIPFSFDEINSLFDYFRKLAQRPRIHAITLRNSYQRSYSEFCFATLATNMDVQWLARATFV